MRQGVLREGAYGGRVTSPVACDLCGHTPPEPDDGETAGQVPLTWLTSVERGRVKVYCDACARTHLRAIESKLDAEWW
jgi:hypothetical protein